MVPTQVILNGGVIDIEESSKYDVVNVELVPIDPINPFDDQAKVAIDNASEPLTAWFDFCMDVFYGDDLNGGSVNATNNGALDVIAGCGMNSFAFENSPIGIGERLRSDYQAGLEKIV